MTAQLMFEFLSAATTPQAGPTISQIFAWIGGATGLIVFIGALAVYVRGSADKGTIASLKESVGALEVAGRLKDGQIDSLTTRVGALETENSVLRDMVTQEKAIHEIKSLLSEHHDQAMERLGDITERLPR